MPKRIVTEKFMPYRASSMWGGWLIEKVDARTRVVLLPDLKCDF